MTSHGMLNNKGAGSNLELRGAAFVLAIDLFSHGNSSADFGMIRELGKEKILASSIMLTLQGLGDRAPLAAPTAVAAMTDVMSPTPLISAVLLNSCDATYKLHRRVHKPYGNKHVGIIADQYDEFMMRDWMKTAAPPHLVISKYSNAQSFLGLGRPSEQSAPFGHTIYHETMGKDAIRVIYHHPYPSLPIFQVGYDCDNRFL